MNSETKNPKPFNQLLDADKEPVNQQKELEQGEFTKAGLWQMKQDVIDEVPYIKFNDEVEAIYLRAYIMGCIKGAEHVGGIYQSPTITRYTENEHRQFDTGIVD